MKPNLNERRIKRRGETCMLTMTLSELFEAIQNEVLLSVDDVVVEVAAHLFLTDRVRYATR